MGTLREAPPSRLFTAVMHRPGYDPEPLLLQLAGRHGAVDVRSVPAPFASSYYEREMGPGLVKFFVSFGTLVPQDLLSRVKRETNDLEAQLTDGRGRVCNLDPGIVTHYSVVLATTKGHAHRIYLGEGIYAEPELIFRRDTLEPLPWSYPDYRDAAAKDFFREVRRLLLKQTSGGAVAPG